MALRVYNTLSKKKEELMPREPQQVKMYVCGPTTYNFIHLGNARPLVVFDTIRRYLEYKGYQVTYVQNFTDIDDKIINKAKQENMDPHDLAEKYIGEYFRDADALRVKRADVHPRATEHIPEMLEMVKGLYEKGIAYEADGDVYFSVRKFPEYGKLSGRTLDEMLSGARVDVDERKVDPLDFVLWKAAKAGEPSWESPWGQVLMWEPDKYYIQEVIDNTKKLDIDSAALTKAAKKLEVISAEQMQAAADLLYVTANYFAQSGTSTLDYQQKLRRIGSWLWNENYNEKHLNTPVATKDDILALENEFFKELRLSHQESSKELLKRLAIMFFTHSKGKIEIIKGMSIEFISLLTRFSTECGTKFEESIRYSFQRLNELEEADTVEKVILWLLTTGNSYIDLLTEKDTDPQDAIINRAISFIRENYASQDLSLSTIADSCHISPSYLSRIFKQKKGHTITEQVNRTRIEEAKHILQECDSTVNETAQKVGFADRSYFYKVFKKQVGLSPSTYKSKF
jgi:two-component system response regulator YesN